MIPRATSTLLPPASFKYIVNKFSSGCGSYSAVTPGTDSTCLPAGSVVGKRSDTLGGSELCSQDTVSLSVISRATPRVAVSQPK